MSIQVYLGFSCKHTDLWISTTGTGSMANVIHYNDEDSKLIVNGIKDVTLGISRNIDFMKWYIITYSIIVVVVTLPNCKNFSINKSHINYL